MKCSLKDESKSATSNENLKFKMRNKIIFIFIFNKNESKSTDLTWTKIRFFAPEIFPPTDFFKNLPRWNSKINFCQKDQNVWNHRPRFRRHKEDHAFLEALVISLCYYLAAISNKRSYNVDQVKILSSIQFKSIK